MIPEELVQRRIFIDPDDLPDWNDGVSVDRCLDKKVFRDEHILGRKLRQRGELLLCLLQQFPRISKACKILTAGREQREENVDHKQHKADERIASRRKKHRVENDIAEHVVIWLA